MDNDLLPLLSVIIPTYNRPQYLARAVQSALDTALNGDVEVIVVPNGGDETWKFSLKDFFNDEHLIISPIKISHANAARNHGLKLARGKYIRFLDDDDFLLGAAQDQLDFMIKNDLDICTGYVLHYSEKHGVINRVTTPINKDDFLQASLEISGLTLVHANIYLKCCLDNIYWDQNIPFLQDNIWMIDLATQKEWRWSYFHEDVGVWFHHNNSRVSLSGASKPSPWLVEKLIFSLIKLNQQHRLTPLRSKSIILRLRNYAHINFPNSPLYCQKLIFNLPKMASDLGVPYNKCYFKELLLEWILFPYRYLKNKIRGLRSLFGNNFIRRL